MRKLRKEERCKDECKLGRKGEMSVENIDEIRVKKEVQQGMRLKR